MMEVGEDDNGKIWFGGDLGFKEGLKKNEKLMLWNDRKCYENDVRKKIKNGIYNKKVGWRLNLEMKWMVRI